MKGPLPSCRCPAVLLAILPLAIPTRAHAAEEHQVERLDWVFGGFRGQYDREQLQRFRPWQALQTFW